MTKKHFEAMAAYVRFAEDWTYEQRMTVAIAFADIAHQFNPRFDRQRFYRACGLGD